MLNGIDTITEVPKFLLVLHNTGGDYSVAVWQMNKGYQWTEISFSSIYIAIGLVIKKLAEQHKEFTITLDKTNLG